MAARAVRVSPHTIRRYTEQDKLEAKPQGEVVRRKRLVSVGSLHALQATRSTGKGVLEVDCGIKYADSIADVVREMAARLESGAEMAVGLHVRLELTERVRSTLADERRQELRHLEECQRWEPWPNGGASISAWSQRRSRGHENPPRAPVLPRSPPCRPPQSAGGHMGGRQGGDHSGRGSVG